MAPFVGIIQLAAKSGLPNRPGSTFRPGEMLSGGLSYHSRDGGSAVDFMGYNQDALAAYFMQFDTSEVIHRSQKTGKVYGSSNNKAYAPGTNEGLLSEHENHLHVAMTQAQVDKALGGAKYAGGADASASGSSGGGILAPLFAPVKAAAKVLSFLMDQSERRRIVYVGVGVVFLFVALFSLLGKDPTLSSGAQKLGGVAKGVVKLKGKVSQFAKEGTNAGNGG